MFAQLTDKGSFWALSAVLVLLPVFFIPAAWVTLAHSKMLLVAFLLIVAVGFWATRMIFQNSVSIPMSIIAASALLLPLTYALSAFLSGVGSVSFIGIGVERDTVIAMTLWTGLLLLAAFLVSSTERVKSIYALLQSALIILGVFHLLQIIFSNDIASFGGVLTLPAASLVGSWHDLAILLGISAFLGITHLTSGFAQKRSKLLSIIAIIVSLLLLVSINAQDVWIALAVLSVLALLYGRLGNKKQVQQSMPGQQQDQHVAMDMVTAQLTEDISDPSKTSKRGMLLTLSVGVFSLVFIFAGSFIHERLPERLRVVEFEVRPSWEGTLAVGSAVYQGKNIIFGSGPNTFTRQWGQYKPAGVNETAFWNTDFVQGVGFIPTSIVTAGLLGALAWLLFLGAILYRGLRVLHKAAKEGDARWRGILFGLFGSVLYMWIMHLVYPPSVALLALAFLFTGVFIGAQHTAGLIASRKITFDEPSTIGMASIGGIAIVAIIIILAGVFSARAVVADMLINRSVYVFNTTGSAPEAQVALGRVVALDSNNARAHRAGIELGILEFQNLVASGLQTPEEEAQAREVLEETISHGLAAVSIDDADYQNWLSLARLYQQLAGVQIEGAFENAKGAYERAALENSSNPEPYVNLAQLEISQGNLESARTYLNEALARKTNYAIAWFLLSQIEATEGNAQGAIEAAVGAANAAPEEPLAWFQIGALSYGAGNFADARTALEQAVALNGNYANALYVLGLTYHELDEIEDSLEVFERVLLLNEENVVVNDVIENIRNGRDPLAGIDEQR